MVDVRELAVRLRRRTERGPIPAEVCRAPFTSMYLDQHGSVRACCQNTEHPLGNVTEQRLRDIWEGPQAKELRDAMLAATGELNRALGGIPNRPEINLEAALQPR